MCKYSLEAYETRNAKEGETLIANEHIASGHGVLTAPGTRSGGELVCVIGGTKLTIENVQMMEWVTQDPSRAYVREYRVDPAYKYIGKRAVVTMIDGRSMTHGLDCLEFECGVRVPLAFMQQGMEVYVGVKPTLDEKLGVDEKGMVIARLDMDPNKKPDDEDKQEPAQEQPAEPAQA